MNDYKGTLDKYGVLTFTPGGNSMWPFISDCKSSVVIERAQRVKKYDVVLFKREDGKDVLHRVISEKDGCYTVCGDNQFVPETVRPDQIYGVLQGYYRGERYIDVHTDRLYRFLVSLWCTSLGIRKCILVLLHRIGKGRK